MGCLLLLLCAILFHYEQYLLLPSISEGELQVYILDVGQGDSILLRTAESAVLIDGGEPNQGDGLVQRLRALGVRRLDYVINSHPHSDHYGGLTAVLEAIPVGALYMPDYPEALTPTVGSYFAFLDAVEDASLTIITPKNQQQLSLGSAVLTFLSVDNSEASDLNACTLVCQVEHGTNRFLFCGDLDAKTERAFVREDLLVPVTVLKCAHHGSSGSSCEPFLDVISPKYVAISVGADNDYGHPAVGCLKRLSAYTNAIYRTDFDGDILFLSRNNVITVQTNMKVAYI
ncbi:MAG: MBL fold metallo-hydrolase [Oscillospiraceae bacterium]|nr:MBL fold metallo-hydrolase [Oscillospiraceae bacterium]